METKKKENLIFADVKEYAAILVIKALIAAAMFALSTVVADTVSAYLNRADGWMKESSQTISRNIIDLYR
jgi:hypothetical protein